MTHSISRTRSSRTLARLWRCQTGAYAAEFAVVTPIMMMLIAGLVEFGYIGFAKATLETNIQQAARQAIARTYGCAEDRSLLIQTRVAEVMSGFPTSNPATVSARAYGSSFSDVGKPEPFTDENGNGVYDFGEAYTEINGIEGWQADRGRVGDMGGPGEVVMYEVAFSIQPLFMNIAGFFNEGTGTPLRASTVVRNEPYSCDES